MERLSSCDNLQPPRGTVFYAAYLVDACSVVPRWDTLSERLRAAFFDCIRRYYAVLEGRLSYTDRDASTGETFYAVHVDATRGAGDTRNTGSTYVDADVVQGFVPSADECANGATGRWPVVRLLPTWNDGETLIGARVTLCHDGADAAVVISVCLNHSVGDAASTMQFFKHWAEVSMPAAAAVAATGDASVAFGALARPPAHDRARLIFPRTASPPDPPPLLCQAFFAMPRAALAVSDATRCRFPASAIERAKAAATDARRADLGAAAADALPPLSKNDVIVASLWRAYMRAVLAETPDAVVDREAERHALVPVNFRARITRPCTLEPHFFGNAVTGAVCCCPSLSAVVDGPFWGVCQAVRHGVSTTSTPEHIEAVHVWEAHRSERPKGIVTPPSCDAVVSSWCNAGVYRADFGLGLPALATPHANGIPTILACPLIDTPPQVPDAGVDGCLCAPPQIAERMYADPEFPGVCVGVMARVSP